MCGVLEMQNFSPSLHAVVDVLTEVCQMDDFVRTKIFWMQQLPDFLTHGTPLLVLLAHKSSAAKFPPS